MWTMSHAMAWFGRGERVEALDIIRTAQWLLGTQRAAERPASLMSILGSVCG